MKLYIEHGEITEKNKYGGGFILLNNGKKVGFNKWQVPAISKCGDKVRCEVEETPHPRLSEIFVKTS